jgi:hypothetical protein
MCSSVFLSDIVSARLARWHGNRASRQLAPLSGLACEERLPRPHAVNSAKRRRATCIPLPVRSQVSRRARLAGRSTKAVILRRPTSGSRSVAWPRLGSLLDGAEHRFGRDQRHRISAEILRAGCPSDRSEQRPPARIGRPEKALSLRQCQ